jgi:hypothetical protein
VRNLFKFENECSNETSEERYRVNEERDMPNEDSDQLNEERDLIFVTL